MVYFACNFYQTNIIVINTKVKTDIIDIKKDIFDYFRKWCKDNETKVPGYREEFRIDFERRFKISGDKIKNNKIKGWTVEYVDI